LYLPNNCMITKDFLKQILADEKKLLKMSALRSINMPKFDELSVKRVYPLIQRD